MAAQEFEVAKKRRKTIEFTIPPDGTVYKFNPPKLAGAVLPVLDITDNESDVGMLDLVATRAGFRWMLKGLNEPQQELLRSRLDDEDDDLDMDDIGDFIVRLQEQITARPTT